MSELIDAITRLAIAVERMEPMQQRIDRRADTDSDRRNNRRRFARKSGLTDIRAVKAFGRCNLNPDEMTRDNLRRVRNCGDVTIGVLLHWAATLETDPND